MRSAFRKYALVWCVLVGGPLLIVAALNLTIDPFRVHRVIQIESLAPYIDNGRGRTSKAEMMELAPWHTIILGSSRAENGFDPALPLWGPELVLNAGLGGPNLWEIGHVFRYAVTHTPVRRVVLCVDFLMFDGRSTGAMDFSQSRFDPLTNPLEYRLGHLFGYRATRASIDTLIRCRAGVEPIRTDRGFRVWERRPPRKALGHRRWFDMVVLEYTDPIDTNSYYGYTYSPSRLDVFAEIVATCRARNIELLVLIPPVHANQLETVRVAGVWDTFETWKRDLVRLLREDAAGHAGRAAYALWDFTGYAEPLTEPIPAEGDLQTSMQWFWEASHFKKPLGDLALARIFGQPAGDGDGEPALGVRLTDENIESHLARTRTDHERYAEAHPDEIARIERLAREAWARARHR